MLFVSEKAVFNGAKAIRGGIPLVFPQVRKYIRYTVNRFWDRMNAERTGTWMREID